jgi:hypothetical protein
MHCHKSAHTILCFMMARIPCQEGNMVHNLPKT